MSWAPARGLVAHYPLDGDLKRSDFRASAPETETRPLPATQALAGNVGDRDGAPKRPPLAGQNEVRFVPGPLGQAASFDGKGFIQGGDIVGFGSHIDEPHRGLRRPVHDGRVDLSHGGDWRDCHQGRG